MEPKFEGKCTYTKANLTELLKKNQFTSQMILLGVIMLAVVVFTTLLVVRYGFEDWGVVLLGEIVFFLLVLFAIPQNQVNRMYKRNLKQYATDPSMEQKYFENSFIERNLQTEAEIEIKYDSVAMVSQTKHLFLMKLNSGKTVMVEKNGFSRGSATQFAQFLKQKCKTSKLKI